MIKSEQKKSLSAANGLPRERERHMELNEIWVQRIKECGADFVHFVDAAALPGNSADGYACAVIFGKALSKEYVNDLKANQKPKRNEVISTERKMDALAVKVAEWLERDGYKSVGKLKTGYLPHKTVALRAGLGFIGKNNLLVHRDYGCAVMLGKVLTSAPFHTVSSAPEEPHCGDCSACVEACPTNTLHGKAWSVTTSREEIMERKRCTLCVKCMIACPYTQRYANDTVISQD